jgi:hypothetical protein
MTPTPTQIIVTTAARCGVPVDAVLASGGRRVEVVRARTLAACLMRDVLGMSYPQVAKELGHRSHTTLVHGCKVARRKYGRKLRTLTDELTGRADRILSRRARYVMAALNRDARLRAEVLAYLRAAIIGQIVAAATPNPTGV